MPESARFSFRITDKGLAAWLKASDARTSTIVEALRTYRLLERNGHTSPRPDLIEIRRQIVGIATNINQLVHIAHRSGEPYDFPSTETLEKIADEIRTKQTPALQRIFRYFG